MDDLPRTMADLIVDLLEGEWWRTDIVLNSDDDAPAHSRLNEQIRILKFDLKLLSMLFFFIKYSYADLFLPRIVKFTRHFQDEFDKPTLAICKLRASSDQKTKRRHNRITKWIISAAGVPTVDTIVPMLRQKVDLLKPSVKEVYDYILHHFFPKARSLDGLIKLVIIVHNNLLEVCDFRGLNLPLPVIEQFKSLAGTLTSFKGFIRSILSLYDPNDNLFDEFLYYFADIVFDASYHCYLCGVNKIDENSAQKIVIKVSHVQKDLNFNSTRSIDVLLKLIKPSKSNLQDRETGRLVQVFINFLVPSTGLCIQIREGLNFVLKLLHYEVDLYKKDVAVVVMNISAVSNEVESLHCSLGLLSLLAEMVLSKAEALLQDLLNHKSDLALQPLPAKDQIDSIIEVLSFLGTCDLQGPQLAKMEDGKLFWKHVEEVVKQAGSIYQLFHAKEVTQKGVKDGFPDLLQKIKIFKLEALLKSLLISGDPCLKDAFKDQIRSLLEDSSFLRTFVMRPLVENDKHIWRSVKSIAWDAESFYHSFHGCNSTEVVRKMSHLLPKILEKNMLFKAEVRKIYDEFQSTVRSNFPKIHGLYFVDFLLGNVGELLNHKADAITSVKHQIEVVHHEMKNFRSFLENISGQFNEHSELKDLHLQIIDVANQAEYIIDSIVVKGGSSWCHLHWLSDLMEEIQQIKVHIAKVSVKKTYGTNKDPNYAETFRRTSINTRRIDEVMVDLPDQAEFVIDRLTRGTSQQDVVAIVGMPGLGKTTLANKVFNEPSIVYHFHVRAWAYVSQTYQKRDLLIDILSDIKVEQSHDFLEMSTENLELKLYQSLKGRKFLIVMDDMWSIEAWNDLERSFPDDQNGSRILITSRHHDAALKAKPNSSPHILRQFTDDESWELLQKKLCNTIDFSEELMKVGLQIAKNCRGLPLAVVAIAGLLKGNNEVDWWKEVAESVSSVIIGDPRTRCMDILDLSYKHLPDYLKPCLLYLGSFMEDKEILVSKLKLLWIAEGLIPKKMTQNLEDIAEKYLMDLIDRSLVMVSKRQSRSNGVKSCRVHDMLRDLCSMKCKEENFSQLITGYDELSSSSSEDLDYGVDPDYRFPPNSITYEKHRLSICSKRKHFVMLRPCGQHVRSLLFFARSDSHPTCPYDISFICDNFKLLRVLDVECINMGHIFPRGIQVMVHLRFLAIRGDINSIPSSIDCLWNLETFLVKGLRGKVVVPESIWSMKKLRHVHINSHALFRLDDEKAGNSSQLDNLVTLSSPSLSYGELSEKIMRRLPNLQKLRCIFSESLEDVGHENHFPELKFLAKLESLKIFYSCRIPYLGTLPFPLNLKKLTLSNFRLPWKYISEIGRLPKLEVLKLLSKSFEGKTWDMNEGEFQELKFLKLDSLNIVEWSAYSDHLPKLQRLVLQNCKHLEEVPSGFVDIATLEMIEVRFCKHSAEESVRRLGEDFEDLKVVINLSEH